MIGAIAGDAIGSRFEGVLEPPGAFDLLHADCRFTDDTVCTLAVAEAIATGADVAATLRRFVRRHPNAGYGGMFLRWAFAADAPAYGSWGNGAPMRTAAVGWLARDEDACDRMAAAQSSVTHDHPDAVQAAQALSRAIFWVRRGVPATEVCARIGARFGYDLRPEIALAPRGFDVSARSTTPAALAAALTSDSWEGAVRAAIRVGGDTDTIACMAGALAEAMHGVPPAIATWARALLTPDLREALDGFERVRSAKRG